MEEALHSARRVRQIVPLAQIQGLKGTALVNYITSQPCC